MRRCCPDQSKATWYNGSLPQGDRGRRRSKLVLYKRVIANGIGRSAERSIDFVVIDTIPGDKLGEHRVVHSTLSRFACRILCDRANPEVVRIYAAGFDSSRNIFLGEKAIKWQVGEEIDGLTTNGVFIQHPRGSFSDGEANTLSWREVSVGGDIFSLRESRSALQRGIVVDDETNILQDGTLIDLCGVTLLWRSAEGLAKSPTKDHLEALVDELNVGQSHCPLGLNKLVIPRKLMLCMNDDETINEKQQPYVYVNCGHVQNKKDKRCPRCSKVGPVMKLCMGIEPAFYVNAGAPTFAFNPCGHMATEKTVKYWVNVAIPHGINGFDAVCPFCRIAIVGSPGYIRLIFQNKSRS
ncbi:Protein pellino [Blattella germanica]|nr:Protein pellino [Blattella germanica]